VVVVCGRGNNGGDGFVVARHLKRARLSVEVWLAARPEAVQGDAARMLAGWRRTRGVVHALATDADVAALARRMSRAALVIDALFGTGLNAAVAGLPAAVIEAINSSGTPVLAVDIASGLSADTGAPCGTAVRAAATVTFGQAKIGQLVHPGLELTGALEVADIGIPPDALAAVGPQTTLLEEGEMGALLPSRPRNAHKGTFGHVLVVAGSRGKLGAALLATEGALRAGAGLTTLAVAPDLQPLCEGRVREAMTVALPHAGEGSALDALLAARGAVVCGPGLGLDAGVRALVAQVVRRCAAPLVLDADGLNAVAGTDLLRARPAPTIVTPHPGEMARLLGGDGASVQGDRVAAARGFARTHGVIVVLKGARTVVAAPDGRAAICPTGNPGMATGGTGDVLAGLTGGLLAQGLAPFAAACLAVYAHGAAGDAVAARRGETGLVAGDLLAEFPPTLARLQAAAGKGSPGARA
jgi:NAD(P)H-hydrate epimerase